jgi:nucleotide-binding universal stress UspA family protein
MHKVLIAVDGSEHARKAVSFVAELAGSARLEAILLNVQPEPEIRSVALAREAVVTAERNDVRTATAAAEAALEVAGVPVTVCVEHGDPAHAIARLAKETDCDHIVMGTRGLGSLAGLVMGSVATKVLQLAHVPVTLVK